MVLILRYLFKCVHEYSDIIYVLKYALLLFVQTKHCGILMFQIIKCSLCTWVKKKNTESIVYTYSSERNRTELRAFRKRITGVRTISGWKTVSNPTFRVSKRRLLIRAFTRFSRPVREQTINYPDPERGEKCRAGNASGGESDVTSGRTDEMTNAVQ